MDWSPDDAVPSLWGKSQAGGRPVPLLGHLLDTAAVADLLWDEVLAECVRRPWDDVMDGRGRDLFRLLAGWHDLGKATPGFQAKVPALAAAVEATGLTTRAETTRERWRHELASAVICREVLKPYWPRQDIDWFWPLLAGHHGRVRDLGALLPPVPWLRGDERWRQVQHGLALRVAAELGLTDLPRPVSSPTRSRQLVLAGHLVMADWIASDERRFLGDDPDRVTFAWARARAAKALQELGLRRGLTVDPTSAPSDLMRRRFGCAARPLQELAGQVALQGPG